MVSRAHAGRPGSAYSLRADPTKTRSCAPRSQLLGCVAAYLPTLSYLDSRPAPSAPHAGISFSMVATSSSPRLERWASLSSGALRRRALPCAGSSRSAPCTSVYVRLQISHACVYCGQISCIALTPRCHTHSRSCSCRPLPQGDAGKSLLSFLLREGSLVREGGLRTALESVCDSSRRQRCDVDLLQKVRSAAVSHATTYA
jgi:hypothetical protein